MIKRLDLADYGKFRKESLHFGPFTVITGPNEAGKTTVFDALFDAVCAESRHEGRPAWKNLAGRYGALRKAEIGWEEGFDPVKLADDEFLEIFAVRAGETSVNAAGGKSWESAAEARLLNSGLNPAQFAAAMVDKAESARKGSLKSRAKELNKELKALEPELAELKAKKDAIFGGEAEVERLEAELKTRRAALEAKLEELKTLRGRMEGLSMSCRLAAAEAGLKALRELRETREELQRLVMFSQNETPAYKALLAEQAERDRAVAGAEAALAEKKAAADAAKAALDALVAKQPVARKQRETALALSEKIKTYVSAPPKVTQYVVPPLRYGIWAGAAALAAFVAWSGRNTGAYAAAGVIVAAGVWVGVKLSIKEKLSGHTKDEDKSFLDLLEAEWTTVSDEKMLRADIEAARGYFSGAAAAAAALTDSIKPRSDEYAGLEGGLKAAAKTLNELKAAADDAAARAGGWLKERGCASEEEYQSKLAEHGRLVAHAGDIMERVRIFKDRYQCSEDDQIRDRLLMEKDALDHKGVDPGKADEPELERLKAREGAMLEEIRGLEAAASGVEAGIEKARAVAGAKLEGLPGRINAIEARMAAAHEELADLDLHAQGYMLAAEVFGRLAEKSTAAFDDLSRQVTATLSRALPESEASFGSFDAGEAGMKDAGGKVRPVKYLSSGARDLFMLAARLMMARKAREGADGTVYPALIVLDDPFYTLDHARTLAAMRLLAEFQGTTGWQVIIFTKDFTLADTAREAGISGITEQKLI